MIHSFCSQHKCCSGYQRETMAQELCSLSEHQDRVWNVSWNSDGSCLASSGGDKVVYLWGQEGDNWVKKAALDGAHQRTIRRVAWSPCSKLIATASFDATISVWDKKSGEWECAATLEGHENEVKAVSWACSGSLLATCSRDKSVWIWEVDDEHDDYECASVLNSHTQDVKSVQWHPNKEVLASCSYDNTIKLYKEDVDDWTCFATLESHESTVWSISFEKEGQRFASVSDDKTMKIWREYLPGNPQGIATAGNDATWKCVCTLSGYHDRTIYSVSWCPVTGLIATACADDCIRIFREDISVADPINQPSFHLLHTIHKAHSQDVNCVAWNPKRAGILASCSDEGDIKLWQVDTGT